MNMVDQINNFQEQQQHLTLILENLEESLIIISDQKIDFVNDKYLQMFSLQISSLPLEQPSADNKEVRPSSLCARILQKFWEKDQTQNSQQINESSKFLETKLFQDVTNDTTVKLE